MRVGVSFSACTSLILGVVANPEIMVNMFDRVTSLFDVDLFEVPADLYIVNPGGFVEVVRGLSSRHEVSIHLPYMFVDISSINEEVRKGSVETMVEIIKATKGYVDRYVIHPYSTFGRVLETLSESRGVKSRVLNRLLDAAEKSFLEIVDRAGVKPGVIGVENLESGPFQAFWDRLAEHGAGICVDIGHLALQKIDPRGVVERYGDRVLEYHVHGVVETGCGLRDHMRVDEGIVDYRGLVDLLEGRPVLVENRVATDVQASIRFLKGISAHGSSPRST